MEHDDIEENIKGLWRDFDELASRLPGELLVGTEEGEAIALAWKGFSKEEQFAKLFALVSLICARDEYLLGALYHLSGLEYEPDHPDDD
ncbi:MAG: hypothetical protein OXH07_13590 [Chloroflexi bacterium]|nr:hypothetical protein [Chloroflexota bacterium]